MCGCGKNDGTTSESTAKSDTVVTGTANTDKTEDTEIPGETEDTENVPDADGFLTDERGRKYKPEYDADGYKIKETVYNADGSVDNVIEY